MQEVSEVAVISAAGVVDPSATSATGERKECYFPRFKIPIASGLATLPVSAGRRRTAATSATVRLENMGCYIVTNKKL